MKAKLKAGNSVGKTDLADLQREIVGEHVGFRDEQVNNKLSEFWFRTVTRRPAAVGTV